MSVSCAARQHEAARVADAPPPPSLVVFSPARTRVSDSVGPCFGGGVPPFHLMVTRARSSPLAVADSPRSPPPCRAQHRRGAIVCALAVVLLPSRGLGAVLRVASDHVSSWCTATRTIRYHVRSARTQSHSSVCRRACRCKATHDLPTELGTRVPWVSCGDPPVCGAVEGCCQVVVSVIGATLWELCPGTDAAHWLSNFRTRGLDTCTGSDDCQFLSTPPSASHSSHLHRIHDFRHGQVETLAPPGAWIRSPVTCFTGTPDSASKPTKTGEPRRRGTEQTSRQSEPSLQIVVVANQQPRCLRFGQNRPRKHLTTRAKQTKPTEEDVEAISSRSGHKWRRP